MATYVVGDIHGCFATLEALLARLELDPERDRLWLVGDLVNRGPASLEVLRWASGMSRRMGERLVAVLGNHDLHLLRYHAGLRRPRPLDTMDAVVGAPDGAELIDWLRHRPLLHRDGEHLLVHAGLPPAWTPEDAARRARRVERALRGPGGVTRLLSKAAADAEAGELRADLATLTNLRTCTADGRACDWSGPPHQAPPGCLPWFQVPGRRSAGVTVICGHWAALGLHLEPGVIALDSACVWGRALSAIRLEDRRVYQQDVRDVLATLG